MSEAHCAIIFGGKSPIAREISSVLIQSIKVFHCSRDSQPLVNERQEVLNANLNFQQIVFDLQSSTLDELKLELDSIRKSFSSVSLVFAHRYRGIADPSAQHMVEVIRPYEISNYVCEAFPGNIDILVFTSPAAEKILVDQDFFYHSNKASLEVMVRYFAAKSSAGRIRSLGIDPGSYVLKDRNKEFFKASPDLVSKINSFIPSQKMTTCLDIASFVEMVVHKLPRQFTGTIVRIDGGVSVLYPDFRSRN